MPSYFAAMITTKTRKTKPTYRTVNCLLLLATILKPSTTIRRSK